MPIFIDNLSIIGKDCFMIFTYNLQISEISETRMKKRSKINFKTTYESSLKIG